MHDGVDAEGVTDSVLHVTERGMLFEFETLWLPIEIGDGDANVGSCLLDLRRLIFARGLRSIVVHNLAVRMRIR